MWYNLKPKKSSRWDQLVLDNVVPADVRLAIPLGTSNIYQNYSTYRNQCYYLQSRKEVRVDPIGIP